MDPSIAVGGSTIIYAREEIPNRMLTKHIFPHNSEGLFIELNFRKNKWLFGGMYTHLINISFNILDKALDVYILITNMFYWLVILMLK